jgi:uncharacterized protein (DUF305 family)
MARLQPSLRRAGLAALVGSSLILLATASGAAPHGWHPTDSAIGDTGRLPHPNLAAARAQVVELDQQFIDMMVPHHQGAVEMARIALVRAEHQEIRDLAVAIIASQDAEIGQMRAWRRAWYGSDQTPPLDRMPMLHAMDGAVMTMGTMNMAADVEALRAAPEPFDRAFIDAMIPHHQSAIDAARLVLQQARRPEIRALAAAIVVDQQREIDQMTTWRLLWYGTSAPVEVPREAPLDAPGMGH